MIASKERGAPAALRAIEEHELRCRNEKDAARQSWEEARKKRVEGDDVSERAERIAKNSYHEALEFWDDATKKLAQYDKQIAPEKREGEKILRSEVEEFFRQFNLSLDLALESYIISLSQDACRAESPEQFYKIHAENLRSCKVAQIEAAIRDEKLPKWAMI